MPAKRPNTRKKTSSKKKASPGLDLVLKRLDKFDQRFDSLDRRIEVVDQKADQRFDALSRRIDVVDRKADQRFDALDRRIDTVDRKVDALRQETVAEFKAVRGEMAQGFADIRQETAQKFENLEQRMAAEFQSTRSDMVKYYSQLDRKIDANDDKYEQRHSKLLTGMDVMVKNYDQFKNDSAIIDAEHQDLKRDVETLKKRDMEKAAAIERIEKQIKAA